MLIELDLVGLSDDLIRVNEPSLHEQFSTRILHITGLTRPFTFQQLKELLRRYGQFNDDDCSLDKIKSQCFIAVRFPFRTIVFCMVALHQYDTVDVAQLARERIDGCRWPLTNPKTLSVRFARQDEVMKFALLINGDLLCFSGTLFSSRILHRIRR
jgi:hypothetical protein